VKSDGDNDMRNMWFCCIWMCTVPV